jgi:hypothetical protein
MRIPIATSADLTQIERVRDLLDGRSCVVVGSAPLASETADVADTDVAIAVNGGISSVARAVDLWVVASRSQDKPGSGRIKPLHKTMLQQAKGKSVGHVLFLRGPKDASEKDTLAALEQLGVRHRSWSCLDKPTKQWMETETCDRPGSKEPCSSGILATAIALWCGAASVRLVGFSFSPGYQYLPNARPQSWWRNHVKSDQRALVALKSRYGSILSGEILSKVAA